MGSLNLELVQPQSGSSEPARANTNVRGFVRRPKAGRSLLHTLFLILKEKNEGVKTDLGTRYKAKNTCGDDDIGARP